LENYNADNEKQVKCYPKNSNSRMPYQKIENEIKKNKNWPLITQTGDEINNCIA
jgi:hypothetical protein